MGIIINSDFFSTAFPPPHYRKMAPSRFFMTIRKEKVAIIKAAGNESLGQLL